MRWWSCLDIPFSSKDACAQCIRKHRSLQYQTLLQCLPPRTQAPRNCREIEKLIVKWFTFRVICMYKEYYLKQTFAPPPHP